MERSATNTSKEAVAAPLQTSTITAEGIRPADQISGRLSMDATMRLTDPVDSSPLGQNNLHPAEHSDFLNTSSNFETMDSMGRTTGFSAENPHNSVKNCDTTELLQNDIGFLADPSNCQRSGYLADPSKFQPSIHIGTANRSDSEVPILEGLSAISLVCGPR